MSSGCPGNGVCTSPKSPDPISSARPLAASQVSKPCDSGPVSAYRSAKLRQVTAVFSGEVMTLMPSMPIWSSMKLMPVSSQSAASSSSMARDASAMSMEPSQRRANPSPVPGPSTEYWTSGLAALKSAATIELIGSTVDDPEMTISPARPASPLPPLFGEGDDPPPHAASSSIPARARVAGVRTRAGVRLNGSLLQIGSVQWVGTQPRLACSGGALNERLAQRQGCVKDRCRPCRDPRGTSVGLLPGAD